MFSIKQYGDDNSAILSPVLYERQLNTHPVLTSLRNSEYLRFAKVLAVAADVSAVEKCQRGPDYKLSLRLRDPSCQENDTVTFNIFKPSRQAMPVVGAGDIVYLDGVKINNYNGKHQFLSNHQTQIEVVPLRQSVAEYCPLVRFLRRWWTGDYSVEEPAAEQKAAAAKNEPQMVCHLETTEGSSVDVYVELLHAEDGRLLCTDYSDGSKLLDHPEYQRYSNSSTKSFIWIKLADPSGIGRLTVSQIYLVRDAKVRLGEEMYLEVQDASMLEDQTEQGNKLVSRIKKKRNKMKPPKTPNKEQVELASIADILENHQETGINRRYKIRAQITDSYPDDPQRTGGRCVLEVTDETSGCLVLCQQGKMNKLVEESLESGCWAEMHVACLLVAEQAGEDCRLVRCLVLL